MQRFSKITGTGSFLPPHQVGNQELVDRLAGQGIETSNEWIVDRTGIESRHFVQDLGVKSSDLALQACIEALQSAKLRAKDIDLIIVATSTPDMVFPSTACILQQKLSEWDASVHGDTSPKGFPAFDVQAVCTGFIYALSVADAMVRAGSANSVLVVGAEVFSRLLDFTDRTTCVLFGDGAGAVVLQASSEPGILATDIHADGKNVDILCVPGHVNGGSVMGDPLLKMDGQAVFKLAVGLLEGTAKTVLEKAQMCDDDIDWLVPHQANVRIISSTAKKLKLSMDKVILTLQQHGNTSAASIPLALDWGVRLGRIRRGQNLLLEGVGGGFTWGSVLVKY